MSEDCSEEKSEGTNTGDGEPATATRIPAVTETLDTIFDVLSDSRRRYLLYYLLTMEGEIAEVDDVLDAIRTYEAADREGGEPPPRKEVWIALHHNHLPRLRDTGILDYDPRHDTIRFSGHPPIEEWAEHARYMELA